MSVLWLVGLTLAFALVQAFLFRHFGLKSLTYERSFDRKTGFEGQRAELIERINNKKILPVPWLRAESRIPAELEFERQKLDEHEVTGGLYHRSIFYMPPMSRVTRHHDVLLKHRGVFSAGSVALVAGDLFSLAKTERQVDIKCDITVYPRILSDDELPDPLNRWLGAAVVKRWIMPDPFLTTGIRDYRPTDPLRDVHWRASARTGDLRVKVRDYTSDPRVFVILNVQTTPEQWADVSGSGVELMEHGIRLAATMCVRALGCGMDAGFASNACFMGKNGSGECAFIGSAGGNEQADRLLNAMAHMTLHRELNFHTMLDELKHLQGEDILILSCYEDENVQKAVRALIDNGNSVCVHKLEGGRRM